MRNRSKASARRPAVPKSRDNDYVAPQQPLSPPSSPCKLFCAEEDAFASHDPRLKDDQPIPVPVPDPPRREERMQVARYRGLRDRTHEGPLYTVRGDNVRIGKFAPSRTATFDPFDSMPAFTDKYRKKRRSAPRLDTRPYGKLRIRNVNTLSGS